MMQSKLGKHKIQFNASNLRSGMYFIRLTAGNNSMTKKIIKIEINN